MGLSGCLSHLRHAGLACVGACVGACLAACGQRAPAPVAPLAILSGAPSVDPGVELPPGPGREVLLRACLGCHDLGGLALFKGFYGRDDWHSLVQSMVEHGASIDAAEVELVTAYLAAFFGPA